jgi:bifunctional non-homologous end joining protein LigD
MAGLLAFDSNGSSAPNSRAMPLPRGFVPPSLPTKAPQPPSGDVWLHEIKHDGFRVIARKDGNRVRLYSRPGNDLTYRFPLIVESLARLRSRSCIIDRRWPATIAECQASTASGIGAMTARCSSSAST